MGSLLKAWNNICTDIYVNNICTNNFKIQNNMLDISWFKFVILIQLKDKKYRDSYNIYTHNLNNVIRVENICNEYVPMKYTVL